jgi:hypothetical protein
MPPRKIHATRLEELRLPRLPPFPRKGSGSFSYLHRGQATVGPGQLRQKSRSPQTSGPTWPRLHRPRPLAMLLTRSDDTRHAFPDRKQAATRTAHGLRPHLLGARPYDRQRMPTASSTAVRWVTAVVETGWYGLCLDLDRGGGDATPRHRASIDSTQNGLNRLNKTLPTAHIHTSVISYPPLPGCFSRVILTTNQT